MNRKTKLPLILLIISSLLTIVLSVIFVIKLVNYFDVEDSYNSQRKEKEYDSDESDIIAENSELPVDKDPIIENLSEVKDDLEPEPENDSTDKKIDEDNEEEKISNLPNLDKSSIIEIYKEYIKDNYDQEYAPVEILFCYLNDDDVPEAFIMQEIDGIITMIKDGEVIKIGDFSDIYYRPRSNEIIQCWGDGENVSYEAYRLEGDKLVFVDGVGMSGIEDPYYYKTIDKGSSIEQSSPITEADYNSFVSKTDSYVRVMEMYDSVETALENIKE